MVVDGDRGLFASGGGGSVWLTFGGGDRALLAFAGGERGLVALGGALVPLSGVETFGIS